MTTISLPLPRTAPICPHCGYEYPAAAPRETPGPDTLLLEGAQADELPCPLCWGEWDVWEMQFAPIPLPKIRLQISSWLEQIPTPSVLEMAASPEGLRLRLFAMPGKAQGIVNAWAAMTHQQTRWKPVALANGQLACGGSLYALKTSARLPALAATTGDPFLALGGLLMGQSSSGKEAALRIWLLGKDPQLQERLRSLASYAYGTEGGVSNDTPNPWGWRLTLWRSLLILGGMLTAACGGAVGAGWMPVATGVIGVIGGGVLFIVAMLGMIDWMQWRSIPKEVLERQATGALFRVGFTLHQASPASLHLFSSDSQWMPVAAEWPAIQAYAVPLVAGDLSALISPPEAGEGAGILDRESIQDIPSPPPSPALLNAPFKIGWCKATDEPIGIDPDGHGLATGGSRTGKTSFAFAILQQLIQRGKDAPGIFLVDPHVSLADAFIEAVDQLPGELRAEGIRRLRIITPDQPEVVPLNLLAVPEFTWAGNAIIQIGNRIWEDYWGPRMQAALLGLFRLAHVWNQTHTGEPLGLLHTVFAAFNTEWRHDAIAHLSPIDRIGTLALDALLGQLSKDHGKWDQGWVTEVISPILSKVMALELSPWLFAALHQDRFVDMEAWVREKNWIVLRLPSGSMGREGARLTAGVVYNVFDAAFRRTTELQNAPIPFYFFVDEAQEIGAGMRLESMLSEGAKFGARMFVLAQSLSMMRQVEGFEAVVDSLLANTSTQAFFSPDPQDADLIRATLSLTARYGDTTLDLPSLHHWLRARIDGRWQSPVLSYIHYLPRADSSRVQAVIREVIEGHPKDYAPATGWQEAVVAAFQGMIPPAYQGLLSEMLASKITSLRVQTPAAPPPVQKNRRGRRLGFS